MTIRRGFFTLFDGHAYHPEQRDIIVDIVQYIHLYTAAHTTNTRCGGPYSILVARTDEREREGESKHGVVVMSCSHSGISNCNTEETRDLARKRGEAN